MDPASLFRCRISKLTPAEKSKRSVAFAELSRPLMLSQQSVESSTPGRPGAYPHGIPGALVKRSPLAEEPPIRNRAGEIWRRRFERTGSPKSKPSAMEPVSMFTERKVG